MRNIPFRARPGKALLKKRVSKCLSTLTRYLDWSIILYYGETNQSEVGKWERKLSMLGNFIPKVCHCTRQEVKDKLDI